MARAMVPSEVPVKKNKKVWAPRQWMVLNARGESMLLDVDKYVIMHRVGIPARDLRILDPLLSYPSTILGREHAIVLNLEHIKAIITAEEVFLRNPTDEDVIPIVEELRRRLPLRKDVGSSVEGNAVELARRVPSRTRLPGIQDVESNPSEVAKRVPSRTRLPSVQDVEGNPAEVAKRVPSRTRLPFVQDVEEEPPFEFRALEVALEAICSFLDARTTELETAAYPALDALTSKISSRNLDHVRKLKSRMTRITARVQKVRDELERLLDDDGDMADFFLSRKLASASSPQGGSLPPNWVAASPTIGSRISRASRASAGTYGGDNDVEQIEMLLEAYFMQIDGTLNKLITLREYIDDTEDYINIQLDNHRNQLIQLELVLSTGTVVMAMYAAVAGIFGMNIPYTWNTGHGYVFKWVVSLTGAVCTIIFFAVMSYAQYKGLIRN